MREREQKEARERQPKRPQADPDEKVNLSDPDRPGRARLLRSVPGLQRAGGGEP